MSLIYAMIEVMDAGIGRIVETLDGCGIADNTILIFTSDNGPALHDWHGFSQRRFNYGFNGSKGNTYEGGIRVPLIIRWLDGLDAGVRSGEMAHFSDWFPTLLNLAGLDAPTDIALDGFDITPVLRGERGGIYPQRFWQWNRFEPVGASNAAMRDGDWKLLRPLIPQSMEVTRIETPMDNAVKWYPEGFDGIHDEPFPERDIPEPPPPLLFNIADDPFEQTDLAAQHPQRVAAMEAELERWFIDVTGI